jgi:hypothetical protein
MASRRAAPVPPPPPEYPDHIGFILAEEDALKQALEGLITVPDQRGQERKVRVWFRYPDPATTITYPFVTLDLVGIEPAYDLWHSEYRVYPDSEVEEDSNTGTVTGHRAYDPSTSPTIDYSQWPQGTYFWRRNYLQYRLFFQIGLWANNVAHDRIMTARMMRDIIMPRPSWLHCPADGVWKRMEPLGWSPADIPTQEGASKRIFRKMFNISVQTDLPQDRLEHLMLQPRIRSLLLRIVDRNDGTQYVPDPPDQWLHLHDWPYVEAYPQEGL